jgi:deoxyhypusine monooxygenase
MRATYFLRQHYDDYVKTMDPTAISAEEENDDEEKKNTSDCHDEGEDNTDISKIVINVLTSSLADTRHGALLRHEFAYVLGQLRDDRAISMLECTLLNDEDDTMVRHECAEALGAIGSSLSIPSLEKCANNDTSIEVGQTCRLALDFLSWKLSGGVEGEYDAPIACACMLSPYSSVDPAPPHPKHVSLSSIEIGSILRDESAPMFERFRAMFSLRNRGGFDAVKELGTALVNDTSSALLRHEVAYVLGQLQHPDSVEYLEISLKRKNEHRMVRHESAEALGAIEERWGDCEAILRQFLNDEDDVVRESCMVALDSADYYGYGNSSCDTTVTSTNFSLHKAESNGKVEGVLLNHFNISER